MKKDKKAHHWTPAWALELLTTKPGEKKNNYTEERFESIAKLYWEMPSLHREIFQGRFILYKLLKHLYYIVAVIF